jgi:choline-sulfatase
VQRQFRRIFNLGGALPTPRMKRRYLNFYANLMRASDRYLVEVPDRLEETGLLDSTLIIRTSDHGEMGLPHGGLRQKNFNFYEESLRVPLVYSNPRLFPKPARSHALVSHVDLLPTLASLAGTRADATGVDYSRLVLDPSSRPVQSHVVFTFDDWQSGQPKGPYPQPPNHIVSVREQRWKLARYYDPDGREPSQWELYDLKADPLERRNLAHPSHDCSPRQERELRRLKRLLP